MKPGTPWNRYPYDSLLLKHKGFRYFWNLMRSSTRFVNFLWLFATLIVIALCIALGYYESMRTLP